MKLVKGDGTGGKDLQDNEESICDQCSLKKRLLESAEQNLKEIKTKFRKKQDRETEIDCMISTFIQCEIFNKDLDDKELDIFLDTYYFMQHYGPTIDEVLTELNDKIGKVKKEKTQKEFKQILDAIEKWTAINNNEVAFIGNFVSFDEEKIKKDKEDIIKDDVILGYGKKEVLEIALEELQKSLKEEKEDFINW